MYSVVKNEGANPAECCSFFSISGAYILSSHFNLNAIPKAGLAAYHVGGDNDVIAFGEASSEGILTTHSNASHSWVEVDGWAIDFMSPLFPDLHKKLGKSYTIAPNMFQKRIAKMAPSILDLKEAGDFYLKTDDENTIARMTSFSQKKLNMYLLETCLNWFKKIPLKIRESAEIVDAKGNTNTVTLAGRTVVGAW